MLTRVAAVAFAVVWLGIAVLALFITSRAGDDGLSIQASSFAPRAVGAPDEPVLIAGVQPDGPAFQAGIRRGALLLAVDGVPVGDTGALRQVIFTRRAGESTTLRVLLPNTTQPRDVTLPLLPRLSRPGVASFVFTYLASGLLALAVVVPLAIARPRQPVIRLLLLAGSSGAIWQALDAIYGGLRERWLPLGWDPVDQVSYLVAFLNTFALLHLFLVFPSRLSLPLPPRLSAALSSRVATFLFYAVPISVVAVLFALHFSPIALIWGTVAAVLVTALSVLVYGYARPTNPLARAQLRWVGAAVLLIAILFAAGPLVEVSTGGQLYFVRWVTAISAFALLYLAIAFAILRYRLFDVHIVLRATLVYPLLVVLVPGAYLALSGGVERAAALVLGSAAAGDEFAGRTSTHIVLGLLAAASFAPLRARLLRAVDALLYRERRALERFYDETVSALARARPIDEVELLLTRGAVRQLDLDGAWLIRPPATSTSPNASDLLSSGGGLARIVTALASHTEQQAPPSPLTAATLLFRLRRVSGPHLLTPQAFFRAPVPVLSTRDPGAGDLAAWYEAGARLLVPLRVQDELVGIWALGQRRSLELPDRVDLTAIARIADRAAVLLDYARLHETHLAAQLAAQRRVLDTERVHALEQLNRTVLQERATLAALMESMRDGLIVVGGLGGGEETAAIRYCSARAALLLNIHAQRAIGQPPDLLLGAALKHAVSHTTPGGAPPYGYTAPIAQPLEGAVDEVTHPGPPRRDLRLEWFPVSDGPIQLGYGLLVRDVTEERALERAKDEFTSMLSHELRSPIGVIKGFAATLLHAETLSAAGSGESEGGVGVL
ncbi:MAG TPA: PDZ domain-containing protein, partial [Aggregicoccus sp.]|nr:PDZ domain-containing protein [Aggregicoccus sp.]